MTPRQGKSIHFWVRVASSSSANRQLILSIYTCTHAPISLPCTYIKLCSACMHVVNFMQWDPQVPPGNSCCCKKWALGLGGGGWTDLCGERETEVAECPNRSTAPELWPQCQSKATLLYNINTPTQPLPPSPSPHHASMPLSSSSPPPLRTSPPVFSLPTTTTQPSLSRHTWLQLLTISRHTTLIPLHELRLSNPPLPAYPLVPFSIASLLIQPHSRRQDGCKQVFRCCGPRTH